MNTRTHITAIALVSVLSCLLLDAQAQTQAGRWKESPLFRETPVGGEEKEDVVKVWDSHPELGLTFEWTGGVNARHEAEGSGELTWLKKDKDETISKYIGAMKNGMREGRGTVTLRSGATYRGDWRQNLKSGMGIYFYADGSSYEGEFLDDVMHGQGTYSEADGTTYVGTFAKGERHGSGTVTLMNGQTYQSEWVVGAESANSLARRAEALAKAPSKYEVQVTLDQEYMQKLEKQNMGGESALLYRSRVSKGQMLIEPNLTLLDTFRERGYVDFTGGMGIGWSCGPVPLILTMENPLKEAITVESGKLQVIKSTPDLQPIIVFYGVDKDTIAQFDPLDEKSGVHMFFGLGNIGEGQANNCVLEFNITPLDAPPANGNYAFKRQLGNMKTKIPVSLQKECASLGVDVAKLLAAKSGDHEAISPKNARAILGPFARFDSKGKWIESNGRLYARLSYDWLDADGKTHQEKTDLQGLVVIDPREGLEFGAPSPVQGDYHLMFSLQKSDYSLPFPFRKRVPAGGNARLRLHVCAQKSSDHSFEVVLKCSDGSERRSAPIQMHYFLPRGEKGFIESGKARLASP